MSRLHNKLATSILSTLAYFDIFDFPLTEKEIKRFLHTSSPFPEKAVITELVFIPHKKVEKETFYFLPKREHIVVQRLSHQKISEEKIRKALPYIKKLGAIPSVVFVGISGSLAMKNGDRDSDIDLFVISLPHTLWLTRLFIWVFLSLTKKRRLRNKSGQDLLCLNLLMDYSYMQFPEKRHDMYTAHEIAQVLPIVNKFQTYELFLEQNLWVRNFIAHTFISHTAYTPLPFWISVGTHICIPFEKISMWLQRMYMKRHQTIEETTTHFIAFHPYNYRDTITHAYQEKCKIYGL